MMRNLFIKVLAFSMMMTIGCILTVKLFPYAEKENKQTTKATEKLENTAKVDPLLKIDYIINNKDISNKAKKSDIPIIYNYASIYSKKYGIEEDVVIGLIMKESNFYKYARSYCDCRGICQISKAVWDDYNRCNNTQYTWGSKENNNGDIWSYSVNIEMACWYLNRLKTTYGISSIDDILIAYNCGPYADIDNYRRKESYDYNDIILSYVTELGNLNSKLYMF